MQTIRQAIFTFLSSISSKYTELRYETVSRMYLENCICQHVYIVKGLSWPYRSKETRAIFRKIPLSEDSRFKPSEKPSRPFSARKSAEASKRRSSRTGIEIAAEWIGFRRDRSPVVSRDEMQKIDALILRLRVR